MKKLLIGAAATAALVAPGAASADVNGWIGASYESNEFDYGEFDSLSLGGALMHDMGNGWAVQADGRTSLQSWDNSDGDYSHGYAAVHAVTTNGNWDFGGYVGILNYYGDGGKMIGAEARTAFGSLSMQGSLGYADIDQYYDYSALDFRISGSYFIAPNFSIDGGIGRTDFETEFTDYEVLDLTLGATYQFANGAQLFGAYVNSDGERDPGSDYEGDTFRIGLRFNLNGSSLQDFANDGASWDGAAAFQRQFERW
jgi:hypothetical protein